MDMIQSAKNLYGRFNKWAHSKDKRLWLEFLVLIGLFVLILFPLATVFSVAALFFPWLPAFIIPVSLGGSVFLAVLGFTAKAKRREIWKTAKYLLIFPICFCGGFFLFGAVCEVASNCGIRMLSSKIRFPFSTPMAIAVDSKERVYCLSRYYNRLQVFDSEGTFLRGWFVNIPKGAYYILIDNDDNLRVATSTWGTNLFFDIDGNLLSKTSTSNFSKEFEKVGPTETTDTVGNYYREGYEIFSHKIIKTSPSGEEIVLICNPFTLWFMAVPFPAFALLMVSILLLFIISRCEAKVTVVVP